MAKEMFYDNVPWDAMNHVMYAVVVQFLINNDVFEKNAASILDAATERLGDVTGQGQKRARRLVSNMYDALLHSGARGVGVWPTATTASPDPVYLEFRSSATAKTSDWLSVKGIATKALGYLKKEKEKEKQITKGSLVPGGPLGAIVVPASDQTMMALLAIMCILLLVIIRMHREATRQRRVTWGELASRTLPPLMLPPLEDARDAVPRLSRMKTKDKTGAVARFWKHISSAPGLPAKARASVLAEAINEVVEFARRQEHPQNAAEVFDFVYGNRAENMVPLLAAVVSRMHMDAVPRRVLVSEISDARVRKRVQGLLDI